MGAKDLLFITVSQNVSFVGKSWWTLMLVPRLLAVLLAGVTLFSDEQERFVCSTIQPGCANVCFDAFAPISVLRLWLFHLLLLCLPHVLFATYAVHQLTSQPRFCSRGASLDNSNSGSSREASLHREWAAPRFYCAYFLAVILRMVLEAAFGAGQYRLFGLSVPKSFLCYEAPCTSGVQCYVSRPTEKTLMLDFMLGVAALSVLLSVVDLASSAKAMARWRRRRAMLLTEELSRGEQGSAVTATTGAEDGGVPESRGISPAGVSTGAVRGEQRAAEPRSPQGDDGPTLRTTASANEKIPENRADLPRAPTPVSNPVPTHFVLHSHLRPPLSPRPDRGPPLSPGMPTPVGATKLSPVGTHSGSQSDSSDSQDKRAWV